MAEVPKPGAPSQRRDLAHKPRGPELFETLLEMKWRDVSFPISSLRTTSEHSLVEHEYYGRDVANVENTGVKSRRFDATIPYYGGQAPGKSETWGKEPLFPIGYLRFILAFDDRSDGNLQHPIHGTIRCKAHLRSEELDADHRSGVLVNASWIETFDRDNIAAISMKNPVFDGMRAAINLDASTKDLRGKVPTLPVYKETFESAMSKLAGFVDTTVLRAELLAHKPAQILSRIKQVQRALERARDASTAHAIDACERLREAVLEMRVSPRKLKRYRAPTLTTLAMVANTLAKSVDEIVKLNPRLLTQLEVPQGTVILYYA